MRTIHDPVDARAARATLRFYVLAILVSSLIGGWCTLLQIAVLISPEIVEHIPEGVRLLAFVGSLAWVVFLLHAIHRLPGIIDDILDRGLMMTDRPERTIGCSLSDGGSRRERTQTFIRTID